MHRYSIASPLAAAGLLLLAGCATPSHRTVPPPGTLTVASVRHTAAPQPAPVWLLRGALPGDVHHSQEGRALLLEAVLHAGQLRRVEAAPLELANLRVRIDARDRRQTVVAIENDTAAELAIELYLSADGDRFRRIPSCPVAAGTTAYERWPESARWFAVGAIRAAGEADRCD